MAKPLILVTNDDGIDSPGLLAAVEAVVGLGEIVIVAPTTQQTSRGRGMVGDWKDRLWPIDYPRGDTAVAALAAESARLASHEITAYHLEASPALAVQHAMNTIFVDRWPDLVVSGINYGENLGMDITISGTVGAALQAAAYGIPAIAASQQSDIAHHYEYGELDWDGARRVIRKYASMLISLLEQRPSLPAASGDLRLAAPRPFPFDILKIDIPQECPPDTPERICRLSRRHYFRHTIENPTAESPLGAGRTWVDENPQLVRPDTDIHALAFDHVVAVTPLTVDCTAPLSESAAALGM
jgi:5'-nucleotidase